MKLIIDLVNQGGLSFMRYSVSDTAEYGDYVVGDRMVTDATKAEMKAVLSEIQDGSFAKAWIDENKAGRPWFTEKRHAMQTSQLETVGAELRKQMSWSDKQVEQ